MTAPPFKVGDWVSLNQDAKDLWPERDSGPQQIAELGPSFAWSSELNCARLADGCSYHVDWLVLEAHDAPAKPASLCTCPSLLYGCSCGGGAAEIAASSGRWKNPVLGLWQVRES